MLGTILGYIYERHWETGSTFDGAFVKSTEDISNKIFYNTSPSNVGTINDEGIVVNMEGYVSKGETGEVIEPSSYVFCSDVLLYDQVKASYNSIPGDSGALVYTTDSSTELVGIHSCGSIDDEYGWFSKAYNLTNEFAGASWEFD